MNIVAYFLDILKYILSGLTVFFVAFYTIRPYLDRAKEITELEIKKTAQAHLLPLRIQAYERLVLLIERINPSNMLLRLHVSGMSAREMQNLILSDLRAEYQHNIAQQLYVSPLTWAVIKRVKEDTLALVNNAMQGLPDNASSIDLSKAILSHLSGVENNPYDAALSLVKRDIDEIL